ncbi:hypothetical protein N9C09_01985, partial [Aquiluna sp.]|nr:hypothetical protein [Aquiluna sp.]
TKSPERFRSGVASPNVPSSAKVFTNDISAATFSFVRVEFTLIRRANLLPSAAVTENVELYSWLILSSPTGMIP